MMAKQTILTMMLNRAFENDIEFDYSRVEKYDKIRKEDKTLPQTNGKELDKRTKQQILSYFHINEKLYDAFVNLINNKKVEFDSFLIKMVRRNPIVRQIALESECVPKNVKQQLLQRKPNRNQKCEIRPYMVIPSDIKNSINYGVNFPRLLVKKNIENDISFLKLKDFIKAQLQYDSNYLEAFYIRAFKEIYPYTDDVEFKKILFRGIKGKHFSYDCVKHISDCLFNETNEEVLVCAFENFNSNFLYRNSGGRMIHPLDAFSLSHPILSDSVCNALYNLYPVNNLNKLDNIVFSCLLAQSNTMPDKFYDDFLLCGIDNIFTVKETMSVWYNNIVNENSIFESIAKSSKTPDKYLSTLSRIFDGHIADMAKINLKLRNIVSPDEHPKIMNAMFGNYFSEKMQYVYELNDKIKADIYQMLSENELTSSCNKDFLTVLCLNNECYLGNRKFNADFLKNCSNYLGINQYSGQNILSIYFLMKHLLKSREYKTIFTEHAVLQRYADKVREDADYKGFDVDIAKKYLTKKAQILV